MCFLRFLRRARGEGTPQVLIPMFKLGFKTIQSYLKIFYLVKALESTFSETIDDKKPGDLFAFIIISCDNAASMSQLIEAIDFPSVITAAHIDSLRDGNASKKCADFMRGYLGVDDYSRFALETLLTSLAHHPAAGAYFLNGAFGAGKSHLLGIVTLLGEGQGHDAFLSVQGGFAPQLQQLPRRLVVYFSLDNYDGTKLGLEEIVEREIAAQATRHDMEIKAFAGGAAVSRREKYAALEEELRQHGFEGLFLCVDELSLFLGAKDHRALQREASWLQFWGQHCGRNHTESSFSYRCCFVLQKGWEDVGDLEPYSLSQIRDRYQTLTLSMAHLPMLVQRRLVRRKDHAAIRRDCEESFGQLIKTHSHIDFGIKEWESLYPFHPSTIQLLTEISSRFFSRTRSAVLFCAEALKRYIQQDEKGKSRIEAAEVFDYFQPEFCQYAELRPLDRVWQFWQSAITRIGRDDAERDTYIFLLKTVLLFRLSGRPVTALMAGNALYGKSSLEGEEYYRYIHQLLMRWCEECDHLLCEKGEDWRGDQFVVDLGQSVKHAVRRLTRDRRATLEPNDTRVISHLWEACRSSVFPLQKLLTDATVVTVDWHNSPRAVEVALWRRDTPELLMNQLSANAQHETKVLLYLALPNAQITVPDINELDQRALSALLLWQPRQLTGDEWEFARETTARMLLRHDPVLRDNRRGRSMLKFLEADLKQREKDIRDLTIRLYGEGTLLCADRRSVEVAELCHQRQWNAMLSAIAAFALEGIYARYPQIAPAIKVLSPTQIHQMQEKLLHQNSGEKWWPASMERPVRSIAAPLGLMRDDKGRRQFAAGKTEIILDIESLVGASAVPVSQLVQQMANSSWGLMPLQSELLLSGLLGAGKLEALDTAGKVLLASSIKPPLQKSVYALRCAALVSATQWKAITGVVQIIDGDCAADISFVAQAHLCQRLRDWALETRSELELANARIHQLKNVIGDGAALWEQSSQTISAMSHIIDIYNTNYNKGILEEVAQIDIDGFRKCIGKWHDLKNALDKKQQEILLLLQRLEHPRLHLSASLTEMRITLREQFGEGEKVLFDESLLTQARQWNAALENEYHAWHVSQYHHEKWKELRVVSMNPALSALAELTSVGNYPFHEDTHLPQKLIGVLRGQCPRDGKLLPGEIVCAHCRLPYGQKVLLPEANPFLHEIDAAIQRFYDLLHTTEIESYLRRSEAGCELLRWDGNSAAFSALLNPTVLQTLEKALAPRRQFTRSLKSLQGQLGAGGTRMQLEKVFRNWLDGGAAVGPDDEITFTDPPSD